jgi:hypothetical protein
MQRRCIGRWRDAAAFGHQARCPGGTARCDCAFRASRRARPEGIAAHRARSASTLTSGYLHPARLRHGAPGFLVRRRRLHPALSKAGWEQGGSKAHGSPQPANPAQVAGL